MPKPVTEVPMSDQINCLADPSQFARTAGEALQSIVDRVCPSSSRLLALVCAPARGSQ